ncbi:MAG: Clp1/GlmU family protein [Promethearchaeota archaeon]
MIKDLKKGNTLIVKGPTRITVVEGEVEVLGKDITSNKEDSSNNQEKVPENVIIVPSALSFPLYALKNSKLEVYTNNESNIELIAENSIPDEWIKIKNDIIDDIKKNEGNPPLKIMVLGISSGKTTLIKYLANNFINKGLIGGYLDSDLGQQILLPTTLMIGMVDKPFLSLKEIEEEKRFFIGATFPKGVQKFIVSQYTKNLINIFSEQHDEIKYILIDTDGWVKTEAGCIYKNFFIRKVDPDILIVFYDEEIEEYDDILTKAKEDKKRKIVLIKGENKYYYEKTKEERRFLRQSRFSHVFEEFQKITVPLDDIIFIKRDYDDDLDEVKEVEIKVDNLITLPYHYVLVGLLDKDSKLINVALLFTINVEKNYILLFSNLAYKEQKKIKKILLGSLRLSIKGNHQGYLYL